MTDEETRIAIDIIVTDLNKITDEIRALRYDMKKLKEKKR